MVQRVVGGLDSRWAWIYHGSPRTLRSHLHLPGSPVYLQRRCRQDALPRPGSQTFLRHQGHPCHTEPHKEEKLFTVAKIIFTFRKDYSIGGGDETFLKSKLLLF